MIKKKSDLTKFSKEYMQKVFDYYDERNEQTGCRKRTFHNVQHRYKCIKNSGYITKFRKYLEENMGALNVSLSKNEISELDILFKPAAIAGTRYHAEGMKTLDD